VDVTDSTGKRQIMEIFIRKGAPGDAIRLTELAMASKGFWGYSDEFLDKCREELRVTEDKVNHESFQYFVGVKASVIIGFCAIETHSATESELEALFVDPDSIGKGVGKRLLEHAIDYAITRGFLSMLIHGDPNAEKFYISAGAQRIGDAESESIPGRMLPVFKITLEEQT
jgi:GNAT superfamily N-acetyltransferase